MKKVISAHKNARGRPATGHDPSVSTRFPVHVMAAIVAWAAEQKDTPQRSEAIRRLVEIGLKREVTERSTKKPGQKARPQQLAARAIDEMQDPSTPPQERPQRRRRLTKGPFEFRGDRVDRPKASEK